MRKPLSTGRETKSWNQRGGNSNASSSALASEIDPLLSKSSASSSSSLYSRTATSSNIRSRHTSGSRSPIAAATIETNEMNTAAYEADSQQHEKEIKQSYNLLLDEAATTAATSGIPSLDGGDGTNHSIGSTGSQSGTTSTTSRSVHHQVRRHYVTQGSGEHPPLLEIPEEIYIVRKSALSVLKPLTKTWVSPCACGFFTSFFRRRWLHPTYSSHPFLVFCYIVDGFLVQLVVSVGFALSVLFGMSRWTGMLVGLPFWFIMLPSWLSHVGLFWCHLLSAKALTSFISAANDSRQRPDSRDHLDRTEYLPLLQRALKFGLKTGLISFGVFIFEILIYFRLSRGTMSWTVTLTPIWIMVLGGILDGIICQTQHFLRLICWLLLFASMVCGVLKADYGVQEIRWRTVVSPIVAVLSISSATLIYIVYGHQIGYYRLTEAQLTAGNLYSLAALISIVLVVVVGEVMPLNRPVEIETRLFVVLMAPLVVTLVGMGAWVVSRDEFGRLLLYGGQSAVHPRKLRWEKNGWTSVQGRGVTVIPMFGEVRYAEKKTTPLLLRKGHRLIRIFSPSFPQI